METIQKKLIDGLMEAEKNWYTSDHFIYTTYPIVKDEKLLLRALENLYKSAVLAITTVLKFEYLYKRIDLGKDSGRNLEIFFRKCAARYNIKEEDIDLIKKVLFLGKKHKESEFEFSRRGRIVILDDEINAVTLSVDEMKKYLEVVKRLLDNIREKIKEN